MKTKLTNIALEKGTHGSDVMGRFCGRGTPFQALCFFGGDKALMVMIPLLNLQSRVLAMAYKLMPFLPAS